MNNSRISDTCAKKSAKSENFMSILKYLIKDGAHFGHLFGPRLRTHLSKGQWCGVSDPD